MFKAILASAMLVAGAAWAGEKEDIAKVTEVFKSIMPGTKVAKVEASAVPGLYQVVYGAQVLYLSADGRYAMQGELVDLHRGVSLTENARSGQRLKLLKKMDESGMIVFEPEKVKHTVTIFTDIDCGYCRKLHREIDSYLAKGIRVRYLSFPRSGIGSKSYYKAVSVWCAKDRQKAMTEAKNGAEPARVKCDNPVVKHMEYAEDFGVSGTPTIVLENGEVIPGYVPADRLEGMLRKARS